MYWHTETHRTLWYRFIKLRRKTKNRQRYQQFTNLAGDHQIFFSLMFVGFDEIINLLGLILKNIYEFFFCFILPIFLCFYFLYSMDNSFFLALCWWFDVISMMIMAVIELSDPFQPTRFRDSHAIFNAQMCWDSMKKKIQAKQEQILTWGH